MDALERILELSHTITELRARRAVMEEELASLDARLAAQVAELGKYVLLGGTNGNGHGAPEARQAGRGGPTGYKKGSVAHRILFVLAEARESTVSGLTGAQLSAATGAENRQVHSMLARMQEAKHVVKIPLEDGRGSKYAISDAGVAALANVREGGPSDELESTA